MRLVIAILCLCLGALPPSAWAGDAGALLQERLHLVTDRACYDAGDRMWLRVFMTDASTRRPVVQSNYVHVELLDETATVFERVMLMARDGVFNGHIDLPPSADAGTYYVRAYVIQNGVAVYGSTVSFTTDELPIVYTDEISNLTPVSSVGIILSWNVTVNGHVSSAGSPAYVQRGFCYDTHPDPTANKQVVSGTGTGSFSKTITGLQNYQTYYVRAFVKTASGTYIYGQNVSFQTYDW